MDNCLFIEELPKEKQPGTHVRRINGKELNDEEMIEYYSNMVKEYGGKLTAKWVYGMVMCTDKGKPLYLFNYHTSFLQKIYFLSYSTKYCEGIIKDCLFYYTSTFYIFQVM